jgi:DNA-3-methyladenine glycosylase II
VCIVRPLDEHLLDHAVGELAAVDDDLAGIAARHGPPPLWAREPGFETLVRIILEQQVSLRSGEAAHERLVAAAGAVEPGAIVVTGEQRLREAGLTRQKSRYVVGLARDVVDGRLDLDAVADADDDAARAALMGVVGIGIWTADIYLLMALRRPDVWPTGDLALAGSMRRAKGLAALPDAPEQLAIAERWRPWRAVAARLLWHAYLAGER